MSQKIQITMEDGRLLTAELYEGCTGHPEISVYIAESQEHPSSVLQDICVVRPNEQNPENVEVLVWEDPDDEDYVDRFDIAKAN